MKSVIGRNFDLEANAYIKRNDRNTYKIHLESMCCGCLFTRSLVWAEAKSNELGNVATRTTHQIRTFMSIALLSDMCILIILEWVDGKIFLYLEQLWYNLSKTERRRQIAACYYCSVSGPRLPARSAGRPRGKLGVGVEFQFSALLKSLSIIYYGCAPGRCSKSEVENRQNCALNIP